MLYENKQSAATDIDRERLAMLKTISTLLATAAAVLVLNTDGADAAKRNCGWPKKPCIKVVVKTVVKEVPVFTGITGPLVVGPLVTNAAPPPATPASFCATTDDDMNDGATAYLHGRLRAKGGKLTVTFGDPKAPGIGAVDGQDETFFNADLRAFGGPLSVNFGEKPADTQPPAAPPKTQ